MRKVEEIEESEKRNSEEKDMRWILVKRIEGMDIGNRIGEEIIVIGKERWGKKKSIR